MSDENSVEKSSEPVVNPDSCSLQNRNQPNDAECEEIRLRNSFPEKESMTFALFVTWIIPVLILAIFSRKLVDTSVKVIPTEPSSFHKEARSMKSSTINSKTLSKNLSQESHRKLNQNSELFDADSFPSWAPTSYKEIVKSIKKRRRYIDSYSDVLYSSSQILEHDSQNDVDTNTESTSEYRRGISTDPVRSKAIMEIKKLKEEYQRHPNDIYRAIALADSMRFYDMRYHEGGTFELESIQLFNKIVTMADELRKVAISREEPTNLAGIEKVNEEIFVDYKEKSIDGLLCSIYAAQGKVYFMANMFERAVESYSSCLSISPYYLDAVNSRGSALLVLGNYSDSGRDFFQVIKEDRRRLFIDAFNGIARVLEANEDSVPGGWDAVVDIAESLISVYEGKLLNQPQSKQVASSALNRLYHFLFTYHDVKTKKHETAFRHLTESYRHKMSSLPPWKKGTELFKIDQTKRIFRAGFWPPNIGTPTRVPIFIIGFVRSGSTLLERILDSHPMIVGTGENSVFNGRLDDIRNQIVEASVSGQENAISDLTKRLGEEVVDEMRNRWEIIERNTDKDSNETRKEPSRFVDKMLTNYYNVGFIHMLYPNALILHVVREPMDTLFSAYKHEFPPGTLDYTSDFKSLSELYSAYRDIMDHWDDQLPGRVTHILYEDMVRDTERIAKAIIKETGLPWDDSVLAFHKKKHAVNTLSSTQVRKGIYTSGLNSWKHYEKGLQPLTGLIGDYINYNVSTSLANYAPLPVSTDSATCDA